jgi:hypothetical protein
MNAILENHPIPPMTDPLGKYWDQPDRSEIKVGEEIAIMTQTTFDKLKDYTGSQPTGAYEGKMWKRKIKNAWNLVWFGPHTEPETLSINYRIIMLPHGKPQ